MTPAPAAAAAPQKQVTVAAAAPAAPAAEGAVAGGFVQGRKLQEAVVYHDSTPFVKSVLQLAYGGVLQSTFCSRDLFKESVNAKTARL
jgi:hypothetical protein